MERWIEFGVIQTGVKLYQLLLHVEPVIDAIISGQLRQRDVYIMMQSLRRIWEYRTYSPLPFVRRKLVITAELREFSTDLSIFRSMSMKHWGQLYEVLHVVPVVITPRHKDHISMAYADYIAAVFFY